MKRGLLEKFPSKEKAGKHDVYRLYSGGPEEIRTPDPYNANVMRSQLRYGPMRLILYTG